VRWTQAVLGDCLLELLQRGAISNELLQQIKPRVAFGTFNPV
jgi:hypothetical protein